MRYVLAVLLFASPALAQDTDARVRAAMAMEMPKATPVGCTCGCAVTGICTCGADCPDPPAWSEDYNASVAKAEAEGKELLIDIRSETCAFCDKLERTTLAQLTPQLQQKYVLVRVRVERYPMAPALFSVSSYPTLLVVHHKTGRIRLRRTGYVDAPTLLQVLSAPEALPVAPQKTSLRAPIGHTHTCAHGHTWDHAVTASHNCPACGMAVYRQDSPVRMVNVERPASVPAYRTVAMSGCVGAG